MQNSHEHSIDLHSYISEQVYDGYSVVYRNFHTTAHLHMLREDLLNNVLPWQDYKGKKFSFNITHNDRTVDDETESKKLLDIIIHNLPSHNLNVNSTYTEHLTGFIRGAIDEIFPFGEAFYEIKCERDKRGSIIKFGMIPIYPPSVRHTLGGYIQIIPRSVAKKYGVQRGIRYIPKNQILHIKPPKQLGGKQGVCRIVKRLISLDDKERAIISFLSKSLCNDYNINIKNTHLLTYLDTARITKPYGWNQREYLSGEHNTLEYYEIYRSLILAKSSAYLRETIITLLNKALNNSYLRANLKVSIRGLNTVSDVDTLMYELKENKKKKLMDIWERGFNQTTVREEEGQKGRMT